MGGKAVSAAGSALIGIYFLGHWIACGHLKAVSGQDVRNARRTDGKAERASGRPQEAVAFKNLEGNGPSQPAF